MGTVFIYMSCHVLCYYKLSPAHCCVASWENSQIRSEVFKAVKIHTHVLVDLLAHNKYLIFID